MKLYVVYGDVWFEGYGSEIMLFGVFTSKKMAEKIKKQKEKEYFENEMSEHRKKYTLVETPDDIKFEVKEIDSDKSFDECLGGYCE